jgi:hypothetical protein
VRTINADGSVSTLAGNPNGVYGNTDGTGSD